MSALLQKIKATNRWDGRGNIKLQTNVPDPTEILSRSHDLRKRMKRMKSLFEQQSLAGRQ